MKKKLARKIIKNVLLSSLVAIMGFSLPPATNADESAATAQPEQVSAQDVSEAPSELEKNGITFASNVCFDIVSNLSGGIHQRTETPTAFDFSMALDTEKAFALEGGTFYIDFLVAGGGQPTDNVGDLQATDNIESQGVSKIFEAWYNQDFLDGRLSVLAGLHDLNSEFQVLGSASYLINSSFGISPEIGQATPSIWPNSGLGTRLRAKPSESSYVMAGVYDGVPGDPKHPHSTRVNWSPDDGLFSIVEAGVSSAEEDYGKTPFYKLAQGFWYSSSQYQDYLDRTRNSNLGYYMIGERMLSCEDNCEKGLAAFFQFAYANPERNQIGSYWGLGLTYTGLIAGREKDVISFGVAQARNSEGFLSAQRASSSENFGRAETAIELTYLVSLLPYLNIQPDFQYVINPGTSKDVDNAFVSTIRVSLGL